MNTEPPIETAISLLKEIRDTTPIVMQRKRIDAFFAANSTPDRDGLAEDLHQLIRVCLTNQADISGFIAVNYPMEYAAMGDASTRKNEDRIASIATVGAETFPATTSPARSEISVKNVRYPESYRPDQLVGALHDKIHEDSGKLLASGLIKPMSGDTPVPERRAVFAPGVTNCYTGGGCLSDEAMIRITSGEAEPEDYGLRWTKVETSQPFGCRDALDHLLRMIDFCDISQPPQLKEAIAKAHEALDADAAITRQPDACRKAFEAWCARAGHWPEEVRWEAWRAALESCPKRE